jgi:hypothetical protein
MKFHKNWIVLVLILTGFTGFAQTPFATIVYAEGNSFSVIRAGKTVSYRVDNPDVLGLPIERGDILQTTSSTYLEVLIRPVSASVQIAENTSFRCDGDESGQNSKGELYYGRVRAKVAKLPGSSTYRISSPAMVAGVRGTDFGCDHFYVRPSAAVTAGSPESSPSHAINRVFCFEGSVVVVPASDPGLKNVLVGSGEMIESSTLVSAAAESGPIDLITAPVSRDVTEFWKGRQFRGADATALSEEEAALADIIAEEERQEQKRVHNHKIRLGGSAALFCAGALAAGLAYPEYKEDGFTQGVIANASYGGVLIGTSLGLLIYDLITY